MLFEMLSAGTFFPLALKEHIIFGIVGVSFFVFQYCRLKKRYQGLIAIAIAATFLLYLGDYMFVPVGIAEAVLMLGALITLIQDSIAEKKKEKEAQAEQSENDEEAKTDDEKSADDTEADAEILAENKETDNGENE